MLKYGMYAKAVELLCFKQALARLAQIYPDMDMKRYKRSVKREYKEMLLRTPDIGGSSLEMNLYIAAFIFSLHKAEPDRITPEVVDERNYRNEGGQLHRTKTLGQGDECCDFHVTRIQGR